MLQLIGWGRMFCMTDKTKALLFVGLGFLLFSVVTLGLEVHQYNQAIEQTILEAETHIDSHVDLIKELSLHPYEARLRSLTTLRADYIEAFVKGDREGLLRLTLPRFKILQRENPYIKEMAFHLADGTTFLRIHQPDLFGDQVAGTRPMIRRVHASHQSLAGFEVGPTGVYYRIIEPLFAGEQYLGAVELGVDLHLFVEKLGKIHDVQVTTFIREEFWSGDSQNPHYRMRSVGEGYLINTHGQPPFVNLPEYLDLKSAEHTLRVTVNGRDYIVHVHSEFQDDVGRDIGGILILQDVTTLQQKKVAFVVRFLAFSLILFLAIFLILYLTFGRMIGAMTREVQERQRAEQEAGAARELLVSLIDSIPDLIFYKDQEGVYLGCNQAFAQYLQLRREEIIGRTDFDLFPQKQAERYREKDRLAHDKGGFRSEQRWITTPAGTRRAMDTIKIPYYSPEGEVIGVIGVSRDVTTMKEAQEALAKAAREWTAAMNISEDAIYLLDVDRHILQANRAFYRMTRSTPEQAIGAHIESIVHPEGEVVPCPVCQAQEEKRDQVLILEADHPDNPAGAPILVTVRVIRDEQGEPLSIFMTLHDLSQERQIEDELRRSQDKWERTFRSFTDVVTLQDPEMHIVQANAASEEILGLSHEEIIGRHCYEIFHGSPEPCENCPVLGATNGDVSYSHEITHEKLGRTFLVSASPVHDSEGKVEFIAHVAKDISNRKRMEGQLLLSEKMTTIAGLAAGVAHEINTPLSAILQSVQSVERGLSDEFPRNLEVARDCGLELARVRDYFQQKGLDFFLSGIRSSAENAGRIIKSLLEFSRPHQGNFLQTDLCQMLDSALILAWADYDLKKNYGIIDVDVVEEYADNLPKIVCVPMEIEQVLLNLIKNAAQAMAGQEGTRRLVLRAAPLEGDWVRIEVSDNGPGMGEEVRKRIFDPFYTTKDVGKGTGLGLSVSYAIVHERHRGRLLVESEPGLGTTFIIELPIQGECKSSPAREILAPE